MDIIKQSMFMLYISCYYNYHNNHLYEHNINEYGLFRHPIRIMDIVVHILVPDVSNGCAITKE